MTLFVGCFLDTPHSPISGGELRSTEALLVRDGVVVERGSAASMRATHPDEVVDLGGGLVLPGFVDAHVHYPQVRMIGALGMPLLDWLEHSALPEEARLADPAYAVAVAQEFLSGLAASGTTTALVFGAHFPAAVDALFEQTAALGLRVTSGLVVSDRLLRADLLTSPRAAYDEGLELAKRWHGTGRTRYAVIPRFSLSCTEAMLDSCSALLDAVDGAWLTSHLNENRAEVAAVCEFSGCEDYLSSYSRHGLVGPRSVYAHNVHPTRAELDVLAACDAAVAHCPTSNSALGSGLFPMREHTDRGIRVALGSDVGAGTGFCLLKEGLQAYFLQQLLAERGLPLGPAHLLHLATSAGAGALGMAEIVGDFSLGKQFDAVWLRPHAGSPLDVGLLHAVDHVDALGRAFALGTPADVARVYVGGEELSVRRPAPRRTPGA